MLLRTRPHLCRTSTSVSLRGTITLPQSNVQRPQSHPGRRPVRAALRGWALYADKVHPPHFIINIERSSMKHLQVVFGKFHYEQVPISVNPLLAYYPSKVTLEYDFGLPPITAHLPLTGDAYASHRDW